MEFIKHYINSKSSNNIDEVILLWDFGQLGYFMVRGM